MTALLDEFRCPWCRRECLGPTDYCGGQLDDVAHPSACRPVLVYLDEDGELADGEAERLDASKRTYERGAPGGKPDD